MGGVRGGDDIAGVGKGGDIAGSVGRGSCHVYTHHVDTLREQR